MIFKVTEYEKVIAVGSDSIFYSLFKKYSLVRLLYSIKKDDPQLSKNAIKILFPSNIPVSVQSFFTYFSQKQHETIDEMLKRI